jgi:hypothetical protein
MQTLGQVTVLVIVYLLVWAIFFRKKNAGPPA